jgi:hypothetical protein
MQNQILNASFEENQQPYSSGPHDAVIRVYDKTGDVFETHEQPNLLASCRWAFLLARAFLFW